MIVKICKGADPYTRIVNSTIKDPALSFRALGVLTYLLSKPPNWVMQTDDLQSRGHEGREAIRTAMNELKDAGYAKLIIIPGGGSEWHVFETPEGPRSREPRNPAAREPAPNNKREEIRKDLITPIVPTGDSDLLGQLTESVDQIQQKKEMIAFSIYQAYPLKVAKPRAIAAIRKALKSHSADFLLERTKLYARTRNGDTKYCPHPATWFNGEQFNDDPTTWAPNSKPQPKKRLNDDL